CCVLSDSIGSAWFTVCSELLSFGVPDDFATLANVFTAALNTDVLGIACFDSDALYLNLINCNDKTNAWAGVGSLSELGIKRRNCFNAWRDKVTDTALFAECIKKKHVFAEETLNEIAPLLALPAAQSGLSFEDGDIADFCERLYFKRTEDCGNVLLPSLSLFETSHIPFEMDKSSYVSFINDGGESKGLYVFFMGEYVEKDEIVFTDVSINSCPVGLEKTILSNGAWAYTAHCPDIELPAIGKAPKGKSLLEKKYESSITVNFVPRGNKRKTLDITVVLVPEKNWQGQDCYYAWQGFSSKEEYIKKNNEQVIERELPLFFLMNEDDYDL
ncbi:MAG: hypothetical protein IKM27_06010, partial [Clostridia bacterium]|nr:hypothetical protein [Clostridia bacterium]